MQYNDIRTNYIKTKIDYTQQNCSLCFIFVKNISTFVGYSMPKLSSEKNSSGIIQPLA